MKGSQKFVPGLIAVSRGGHSGQAHARHTPELVPVAKTILSATFDHPIELGELPSPADREEGEHTIVTADIGAFVMKIIDRRA